MSVLSETVREISASGSKTLAGLTGSTPVRDSILPIQYVLTLFFASSHGFKIGLLRIAPNSVGLTSRSKNDR